MTKTINTSNGKLNLLTVECIKELHNLLSENYKLFKDMEPISPPGVKNNNMLESAVYRQETGIDDYYKYNDTYSNSATLCYGIIKNHAFHNGNKRTGLLALIKHLHSNGYVLRNKLGNAELYELIVCIAKGNLNEHSKIYSQSYKDEDVTWDMDGNIGYLAFWIKQNSMPKSLYIAQQLKTKTLKSILNQKGIQYKEEGKYIVLEIVKPKKLLGIKYDEEVVKRKKYFIGKRKEKIKKSKLDKIRKDFNLTRSDGVDNVAFYDDKNIIDEEIKKYKQIIYRLSKT